MSIEQYEITVDDLTVTVVRKRVKNIRLGVYPPHGQVRIAAPLSVTDETIRLFVIDKLKWIKKHQARLRTQSRESARGMINGESHYFLGQRYSLCLIHGEGSGKVTVNDNSMLEMLIHPETTTADRERVLYGWYHQQLQQLIPPLLEKWQHELGERATSWGIKKMRTRWGSCNVKARHIWLNLELAKRPLHCLEYVLVHELVHLMERSHNARFKSLMSQFLPQIDLFDAN